MSAYRLGHTTVPGTYHVIGSVYIQVGPALKKDSWGRVLVEIQETSKGRKARGLTYQKGKTVWLSAERIVWNQGASL